MLYALGLLAAFSAALLNPYGRRLLLTMFLVVAIPSAIWITVALHESAPVHDGSEWNGHIMADPPAH